MRLSYKDVLKRISGISTPIFGVSWNPPKDERDIVQALITYLEGRRALLDIPQKCPVRPAHSEIFIYEYLPSDSPILPRHREAYGFVIKSVLSIRERLDYDLEKLDRESELFGTIASMRNACLEFLEEIPPEPTTAEDIKGFRTSHDTLRLKIGQRILKLSIQYGIDLKENTFYASFNWD